MKDLLTHDSPAGTSGEAHKLAIQKVDVVAEVLTNLEQDYNAMSEMIFGDVPAFGAIIESTVDLEKRLNR